MSSPALTDADLQKLAEYDTPTICNALEIVVPERRGFGYTWKPLVCARPELPPMVGYACTATMRAMRPGSKSKEEGRQQRYDYYDYIDGSPSPRILVIQDLDDPPGFGAYWGEVQTNVHKALGCLGGITNGSIRDMDAMAEDFQMLAGSIGPSHAWVHLEDFSTDVNIHGMHVTSGDLIHADRHGAVVVPHDAAKKIPEAIDLLNRREAVVIGTARDPGFTVQKLKDAIAKMDEIH